MGLHITDTETEKLAAEIAEMTGDTKAGAVREALREKKERLKDQAKRGKPKQSLLEFFEKEIWPRIPEDERGKPPLTKEELEEILGYGPEGA